MGMESNMEKKGLEMCTNRAQICINRFQRQELEIQVPQSHKFQKATNIWKVDCTLDKNISLNACDGFFNLHHSKNNV